MGGLHSGRKRKHICIDDCIVLDLAQLRKQKLLRPGTYSLAQKMWIITDYHKKKDLSYTYKMHVAPGCITLSYQAVDPEQEYTHTHALSLTSTSCNYGGSRLWFLAPCCGNRVRVLYINPKQRHLASITPQCRICLELHYTSQMASYIERHKTYERFLLANYGLTWAADRYDYELKEHYLKVTPELRMIQLRSELDQRMKTLRLLMRFDRSMVKEHSRNIDSLKLTSDLDMYVCHIIKEWGPCHMQDIIYAMRKPEKRVLAEQTLAAWLARGEKHKAPLDLARMRAIKEGLEEEIALLEAA